MPRPTFNIEQYELRGLTPPIFTEAQKQKLNDTLSRVNGQIDWTGQLLGFSGEKNWGKPNPKADGSYDWIGLPETMNEKRQLQTGAFGVYNKNQDYSKWPSPFNREKIKASGDAKFHVFERDGHVILGPLGQPETTDFMSDPVMFKGGYYEFDDRVTVLNRVGRSVVYTTQHFYVGDEVWTRVWIDENAGAMAIIAVEDSLAEPATVSLLSWEDISDWNIEEVRNQFLGIWGNKGNQLSMDFAFDALDLHAFDERYGFKLTGDGTFYVEELIEKLQLKPTEYYGYWPEYLTIKVGGCIATAVDPYDKCNPADRPEQHHVFAKCNNPCNSYDVTFIQNHSHACDWDSDVVGQRHDDGFYDQEGTYTLLATNPDVFNVRATRVEDVGAPWIGLEDYVPPEMEGPPLWADTPAECILKGCEEYFNPVCDPMDNGEYDRVYDVLAAQTLASIRGENVYDLVLPFILIHDGDAAEPPKFEIDEPKTVECYVDEGYYERVLGYSEPDITNWLPHIESLSVSYIINDTTCNKIKPPCVEWYIDPVLNNGLYSLGGYCLPANPPPWAIADGGVCPEPEFDLRGSIDNGLNYPEAPQAPCDVIDSGSLEMMEEPSLTPPQIPKDNGEYELGPHNERTPCAFVPPRSSVSCPESCPSHYECSEGVQQGGGECKYDEGPEWCGWNGGVYEEVYDLGRAAVEREQDYDLATNPPATPPAPLLEATDVIGQERGSVHHHDYLYTSDYIRVKRVSMPWPDNGDIWMHDWCMPEEGICDPVDGGIFYELTGPPDYDSCECSIECCLVDNGEWERFQEPPAFVGGLAGEAIIDGCIHGWIHYPHCAPPIGDATPFPCPDAFQAIRVDLDEGLPPTWKMEPTIRNSLTPLRTWKNTVLSVVDDLPLPGTEYHNFLLADINRGPEPESDYRYFVRLPLEYPRNGEKWNEAEAVCENLGYFSAPSKLAETQNDPAITRPPLYSMEYWKTPQVDWVKYYEECYLVSNWRYDQQIPVQSGWEESHISEEEEYPVGFDYGEISTYDPYALRVPNLDGSWQGEYYIRGQNQLYLSGYLMRDLCDQRLEDDHDTELGGPTYDLCEIQFPNTEFPDPKGLGVDEAPIKNYVVSYAYFAADFSAADDPVFDPDTPYNWRTPVVECTSYEQPETLLAVDGVNNPVYDVLASEAIQNIELTKVKPEVEKALTLIHEYDAQNPPDYTLPPDADPPLPEPALQSENQGATRSDPAIEAEGIRLIEDLRLNFEDYCITECFSTNTAYRLHSYPDRIECPVIITE